MGDAAGGIKTQTISHLGSLGHANFSTTIRRRLIEGRNFPCKMKLTPLHCLAVDFDSAFVKSDLKITKFFIIEKGLLTALP